MKVCKRCKISKQLTDFYKDAAKGLRTVCKKCSNELSKEYKIKNPNKVKQYYFTKELKRRPYIVYKKDHCEQCNFIAIHPCQLDVDHMDGNHKNNNINNLRTLCSNCHRLKTFLYRDHTKWRNAK